jgi:hypothetical protein
VEFITINALPARFKLPRCDLNAGPHVSAPFGMMHWQRVALDCEESTGTAGWAGLIEIHTEETGAPPP